MNNKERGLYQKYNVERVDGRPTGDCIVLEFKDPNARAGIRAFSKEVKKKGYSPLADDLDEQCEFWDKYDKDMKQARRACRRAAANIAKSGR